jgi:hypothetical protein
MVDYNAEKWLMKNTDPFKDKPIRLYHELFSVLAYSIKIIEKRFCAYCMEIQPVV